MALFEKFLSAGKKPRLSAGSPDGAHSTSGAQSGSTQQSVTEGQVEAVRPKTSGKFGERPARYSGRPPLPDHLRKYPKRKTERHDEHGRVIKKFRKRKNDGPRHYKVRRKKARLNVKQHRVKTNYRYCRQYDASIWRKYLQNRQWNRRTAKKKGLDPDAFYRITFADWLRVWSESEDVYRDGRLYRPVELQDNPVRHRGECTWFSRVDESEAFTLHNVCIRYRGKPLKRTPKD